VTASTSWRRNTSPSCIYPLVCRMTPFYMLSLELIRVIVVGWEAMATYTLKDALPPQIPLADAESQGARGNDVLKTLISILSQPTHTLHRHHAIRMLNHISRRDCTWSRTGPIRPLINSHPSIPVARDPRPANPSHRHRSRRRSKHATRRIGTPSSPFRERR
jgi:hypothetical protein